MNTITPETKDLVLAGLVETGTKPQFDINEYSRKLGIDAAYLEIILDQFENMGLMSMEKMLGGTVMVFLTADAFDLHRAGGFQAKEELFKLRLEKLKTEIEQLRDTAPEATERITNIISNIFSVVPFLLKA